MPCWSGRAEAGGGYSGPSARGVRSPRLWAIRAGGWRPQAGSELQALKRYMFTVAL